VCTVYPNAEGLTERVGALRDDFLACTLEVVTDALDQQDQQQKSFPEAWSTRKFGTTDAFISPQHSKRGEERVR
jgi:hypothetical protein